MMNELYGILVFIISFVGTSLLLRWSVGKTLVITWKPFSIKIEEE